MNLIFCDKCGNRNIMCYSCVNSNKYKKSDFSHDEYIKRESIKKFAEKIEERLKEESKFVLYEMNEPSMYAGIERAIEILKQECGAE